MHNNPSLELLRTYLRTESYDDFEILSDNNVIFWVDWREEDQAIVEYCENRLKTGQLSAATEDTEIELLITYKGKTHKVSYTEDSAYRDETLIALNNVIAADYQLRFCRMSEGNDTLAFLAISNQEIAQLENEFTEQKVANLFAKITEDLVIFG